MSKLPGDGFAVEVPESGKPVYPLPLPPIPPGGEVNYREVEIRYCRDVCLVACQASMLFFSKISETDEYKSAT